MTEMEQIKPLAPSSHRIIFEDDHAISTELKKHRSLKFIKCCGCIVALVLILSVTLLVLIFTVLKVKEPEMKMNSMMVQGLDRVNPTTNLTVIVDVSVKNPNVASFKFTNSTTSIYYGGMVVGEGRNPPGIAKARRTLRMNVTIDVILEKVVGVERFSSDWSSRTLLMSSYTMVDGRVKIIGVFKKHVVVKMNCTMTVNITSRGIQDQNCKHSVLL
ncbi:unnamed protein product [Camellia sinensis]|uniref:Late embryogenesis abundant protein LEA-2 subgroup domain-containing protein n=2 Tax=Camellia sinensis TaxID=4442 RepID=A0A7J7G4I4_CAMSI|nr:hypothetical protein HYC85_026596 [Camellia sinensis]